MTVVRFVIGALCALALGIGAGLERDGLAALKPEDAAILTLLQQRMKRQLAPRGKRRRSKRRAR